MNVSDSFGSHADAENATPSGVIDYTGEDFDCDERLQAMGFVGEHSERAWLYRLKQALGQGKAIPVGEHADHHSISSMNYFQDESDIPLIENLDLSGQPPPRDIADQLVDDYFQTVHPAFPVIERTKFIRQYKSFYSNPDTPPAKQWLAIFNLIMAISARHSLLLGKQSPGEHDGHTVYFSRSWLLSLNPDAFLSNKTLQQVQVEALTAFYLLSVGQVNRESDTIEASETRYQVWWGLFTLDTVLCIMTGHPPCIGETYCTAPLPVNYEGECSENKPVVQPSKNTMDHIDPVQQEPSKGNQSEKATELSRTSMHNISPCFIYTVHLTFAIQEAVNTLYAPRAARRSWLEIEMAISSFNNNAEEWRSRLPANSRFTEMGKDVPLIFPRAGLAFQFYSTKLIISQPCLRRITQISSPGCVCEAMAVICIEAAVKMIDILPDKVDIAWLYKETPWWCILHYVMQSTSVLLIALFNKDRLAMIASFDVDGKIKKALRWLEEMSTTDISSRRAWSICEDILSQRS
ncbi:transcriptional regulator family: Fungal Specific TF [Penicillium verhagenii]|uniref:transcriptional regulator family: Fungal Specific TF n=1 Tax=Penicillium verhagenii TaxID=1562060 RepID=UPI0025454281|nr:transcriptional regulator family: Fungal Specific TF [Penicillium verhagenii]KAJ5936522.1 transcriptional regulator family: Fungal Specific TF [Penicillium verhagenii]